MILLKKAHPVAQAMSARPITQAELLEAGQYRNPGEPNAEQSASSEYSKPRMKWRGLNIAIENPAGSVRRGRNRHGVTWEQRMLYDYGEILGSMGVDGDPVDVFIGPNLDAPKVYVVHQRRVNDWDNYDEDKCMIGFDSEDEARAAFLSCYSDPRFLGPITTMIVDDFVAKVRATKEKPAMIKSILFFKGFVGPYLRGGKIVNVSGYHGRNARSKASPGQMSLFGSNTPMGPSPFKGKDPVASTPDLFDADEHGEMPPARSARRDVVTTPRSEMIAEHERLVDVLNSPSREDDKAEAKKQEAELAEYKQEAGELDHLLADMPGAKPTAHTHYKAKDAERKSGKPSTSQPLAEKSGPEVKTMMSAGTHKNWLKVVPRLGKVNGWDLFHDKLDGERFVLMTSYNSVGFDSEAEAREWAAQNKANPRGDFNGAPMTKSIVFLRCPAS